MTNCKVHRDSIEKKPYDYIAYMHAWKLAGVNVTKPEDNSCRRFLDDGCGLGSPAATLDKIVENCEVTGVDTSERNIDEARRTHADTKVRYFQVGEKLPQDYFEGGMNAFSFPCMKGRSE